MGMMQKRHGLLGAVIAVSLAASCSDIGLRDIAAPEARFASSNGPNPLECPVNVIESATATIGPLGGTIAVGGHSVVFPLDAVLTSTMVTLTVPASNYMEIDITANGLLNFDLNAPATVTIDYGRCNRQNIQNAVLEAWYWDSATRTFLEDMEAEDDRDASQVRFTTDHFSGYVVAN